LVAGKRIMEIYENEDFHLKYTGISVLSEEGKDLSYDERKV